MAAGEFAQKQEEEQRVERVEQGVHEVEAPGILAQQGDIEHVGDPKDGEVHGSGSGTEKRLFDGCGGKAARDHGILGDEGTVVQVDEVVADRGKIEKERQQKRQNGENGDAEAGRWRRNVHDRRKDSRGGRYGRGESHRFRPVSFLEGSDAELGGLRRGQNGPCGLSEGLEEEGEVGDAGGGFAAEEEVFDVAALESEVDGGDEGGKGGMEGGAGHVWRNVRKTHRFRQVSYFGSTFPKETRSSTGERQGT